MKTAKEATGCSREGVNLRQLHQVKARWTASNGLGRYVLMTIRMLTHHANAPRHREP